jgi:hypothetical protein
MHSRHDPETTLGQTQQAGDKRQTDRQQSKGEGRHHPEGAGILAMVTGKHMIIKADKNGHKGLDPRD